MTDQELTLDEAVMGAAEAPPSIRIEYRDPIARHGSAGIDRVTPWLSDVSLAAFAVRVIARAADFGAADHSRQALQSSLSILPGPARQDAIAALEKLGVSLPKVRKPSSDKTEVAPMAPDDLIEGKVYKRRDLHDAGLGGNQQKGISYPAGGTYVFLFSDPDSTHDWGYKDSWLGDDAYRYYGEWNGTGDMLATGGNKAIVDRSPEIYLLVKVSTGHRYAGTFACVSEERVPTARDGREYSAIVFRLERAKFGS